MDEWIVGRKEICAALHLSWRSVLRWKKRYGIDFVRWPNGKPAMTRRALNRWLIRMSRGKSASVTSLSPLCQLD